MKRMAVLLLILAVAALACDNQVPATPFPTPNQSSFDAGRTVYGVFPSPPEVSLQSILPRFTGRVSSSPASPPGSRPAGTALRWMTM